MRSEVSYYINLLKENKKHVYLIENEDLHEEFDSFKQNYQRNAEVLNGLHLKYPKKSVQHQTNYMHTYQNDLQKEIRNSKQYFQQIESITGQQEFRHSTTQSINEFKKLTDQLSHFANMHKIPENSFSSQKSSGNSSFEINQQPHLQQK